MPDVLRMLWEELVVEVEGAAAAGDGRAGRLLRCLLEHEAAGGDTGCVITRLACRPVVRDL
jgi:hypothetical protein